MSVMSNDKATRKYSLLAVLFLIVMAPTFAAPPRPIDYQGYLTQPDSTPIDAAVDMVVELWTAATGGTLLYAESHTGVVVSRGRFTIEISTGTPLSGTFDADQFKQDTWLALTINGELLNPRSRLGAVAGSQHSEIAERLSTSCADGEWIGFRNGALACYECSTGSSIGCFEGGPETKDVGVCKGGTRSCDDGLYNSVCAGQVLPGAEICNSKDDDCNGLVDDGASLPGCVNLYADTDGDGFGDTSTLACLCTAPSGYTNVGGDCDDADFTVKPGQAAFFNVASAHGSFDYNCDGNVEMNWSLPVASCTYNGSTCDYVYGFKDSIPACGETRAVSTGCTKNGTTCTVTSGYLGFTMGCR
jgi:Putative metal-binding motif